VSLTTATVTAVVVCDTVDHQSCMPYWSRKTPYISAGRLRGDHPWTLCWKH